MLQIRAFVKVFVERIIVLIWAFNNNKYFSFEVFETINNDSCKDKVYDQHIFLVRKFSFKIKSVTKSEKSIEIVIYI